MLTSRKQIFLSNRTFLEVLVELVSLNVNALHVAEIIKERIVSPIPSLVYSLVENSVGFASQSPNILFPILKPFFLHPQLWTRLTALYLALLGNNNIEIFHAFEKFIDDIIAEPPKEEGLGRFFRNPLETLNKSIAFGMELIVETSKTEETKERIKQIYTSTFVNGITQEKLRQLLLDLGCKDFIDEQEKQYRENMKDFLQPFSFSRMADKKMLEVILQITGVPIIKMAKRRKLYHLAKLMDTLNVFNAPFTDWNILSRLDDVEAVKAVLSGFIIAFSLDNKEIAKDVFWAINEIDNTTSDGLQGKSLLSMLPHFPTNYDDYEGNLQNVSISDLLRALHHPSGIISRGAAWLLYVGNRKEEMASLLDDGDEGMLQVIANIADDLWKEDARPLLIERLERGYTSGCNWLIEALPRLVGDHNDDRFKHVLLKALIDDSHLISIAAVHALREMEQPLLLSMYNDIRKAYDFWLSKSNTYHVGRYYSSEGCLTCRIAPGNAIAHLLQFLSQIQPFDILDLLALCQHEQRDIRRVAAKELTTLLTVNPTFLPLVIKKGYNSRLLIGAIFAVPSDQLILIQDDLCNLASSGDVQIRLKLIRALKTAGWLPLEKAKDIVVTALQDESPFVRDEAFDVLQHFGGEK